MNKSVMPNFKKWSTDERRLLVVFLLTLIYPVFVSSFFALYVFVLVPLLVSPHTSFAAAHHAGWYHLYWLFASMLWVILCVIIIPSFKKIIVQNIKLSDIESSALMQPDVKAEAKNEEDSQSNLSLNTKNSSDNIKKIVCDLESEKECLGISRESLHKSTASLERKKLTQSGEFLNDFMNTIQSEDVKKNEAVCEIHAEESKVHNDSNQEELKDEQLNCQSEKEDSNNEITKDISITERLNYVKDVNCEEFSDKNKEENHKDLDNSLESSSSDEDVEPFVSTQRANPPQTSSPSMLNEAVVEQHKDASESEMIEEVDTFERNVPEVTQEKAHPSIDTSRTSGCYECSMPTPMTMERQTSQNNTVFLFINPDIIATEDNVLVSHGGEVKGDTEI